MSARAVKKRVTAGLASQEVVSIYIKSLAQRAGMTYRVAKKASYGQKDTDIAFVLNGQRVGFEVKGTARAGLKIAVFDKSVRRRNVPAEVASIAQAFLETLRFAGKPLREAMRASGYPLDFLGLLDYFRDHSDPAVGLAEDPNTAASGKLPKELSTTDQAVCRAARKVIMDAWHRGGDHYFCVHDKSTDDVDAWHTGLGHDLLQFGAFPQIRSVSLDTYGGQSKGATRVGLKITL